MVDYYEQARITAEKWRMKKIRSRDNATRVFLAFISNMFVSEVTHPVKIRNQFLRNERGILEDIKKGRCKPTWMQGRDRKHLKLIREATEDARVLIAMRRR